jgi:hypothetical protein
MCDGGSRSMLSPMRALVVVVGGLMIACSGSRPGSAGAEDRQSSTPDRLACQVDADCVSAPLHAPDEPCCDTGVHLGVVSRAYEDWRRAHRLQHCADVACPALPSPTPPRPCATEPRCLAGQCSGSCDAPSTVGLPTEASEAARQQLEVAAERSSGRWLRVSVEATALIGCEASSADAACEDDSVRRALDEPAQRELDARWSAFLNRPGCRVRIDDTGWARVRIAWSHGSFDARSPTDPDALEPAECFSPQRLVGWIVREFDGR